MLSSGATLAIFLAGTLAAAFVTGLSGFAFALVALAIWLHVLAPSQATPLVAAYALLVQGYAVWKLRRVLKLRRLVPFIVGTALGVLPGVAAVQWISPAGLRVTAGIVLILFSLNNLLRPQLPNFKHAGRAADTGVGFLNGLLGGSTGLAGISVVVWSGMRGWPADEQRAVFQPTAVVTFVITILALGGTGSITPETGRLFLIGLPALAVGTWPGWTVYGRLDEASFRRAILVLLLVSGFALVAAAK